MRKSFICKLTKKLPLNELIGTPPLYVAALSGYYGNISGAEFDPSEKISLNYNPNYLNPFLYKLEISGYGTVVSVGYCLTISAVTVT